MKRSVTVGVALAVAALSVSASAAETIDFSPGPGLPSGYSASGSPLVFTNNSGTRVSVTGWSVDSGNKIRSAQLGLWSEGIGVKNGARDDSHTIDNSGWTDFILLQFEKSVILDMAQLNTGWHGFRDTDATIGFGILPISQISSLNGTNWPIPWLTTFESGRRGNSGDSYRNINPNDESGNVWLIGASFSNPENRNRLDGFKLEAVTFTSAVPEPGTWMLMILGLGMLGAALRRRRSEQARIAFSF